MPPSLSGSYSVSRMYTDTHCMFFVCTHSVRECVQHGLLKAFDVQTLSSSSESDVVASFTVTFALTKNGVVRLTPAPVWYSPEKVKASVEIKNEETKTLITRSLKPSNKKKTEKKTEVKA